MSTLKVPPYQVDALRVPPVTACSARGSPVDHAQVYAPWALGVTVAYDGRLVVSLAIVYPSLPYPLRHPPNVVVSVPLNVAVVDGEALPGLSRNTALTTALEGPVLIIQSVTWPRTVHFQY